MSELIDLRRALGEFERMQTGEIAPNPAYLQELIDEPGVTIELCCVECDGTLVWVDCPECAAFEPGEFDCFLCENEGGWYDCESCNE